VTDHLLVGPFWTRIEAAHRTGIPEEELLSRPDVIHIGGRSLPEAYVAFQFDRSGIRRDLARVVLALRGRYDDIEIANWLVRENPHLLGTTPLAWLNHRHRLDRVLDAAAHCSRGLPVADVPQGDAVTSPSSAHRATPRQRSPAPQPTMRPASSH
jgi:hypothetical protein